MTTFNKPVRLRPLPTLTPTNHFFWTSGADGRLRIQRCQDCGYYVHPPTGRCPRCLSIATPEPVSGEGTVFSYTINWYEWYPTLPPPYAIVLVELAEQEGLRLTSAMADADLIDITVGMRVRVTFRPLENVWLPLFEPVEVPNAG
jgi:uncharacterized OB-fold protein